MKIKILFILIMVLVAGVVYSQQNFCTDSSFRIKYVFGNNGGLLFNKPDTSGKNYFTGAFAEGLNKGLAFLKTNWGDSMIIAKKIIMTGYSLNSYFAPNGTIICTGTTSGTITTNPELLICRLDTNGTMLWVKRYKLSNNHQYYKPGSFYTKNILVANNAIYLTANFNNTYDVVAKLDLNGNIIWSRSFGIGMSNLSGILNVPMYSNGAIFLQCRYGLTLTNSGIAAITKLDDTDGIPIESYTFKTSGDPLLKGISSVEIKYNINNSLSLTGYIESTSSLTFILFNTLLDVGLNPVRNYYFKTNTPLSSQQSYFDFNNQKQHAYLSEDIFKLDDKYFITFGKDDEIVRSRKFVLPASGNILNNSLNFDDKQNLHFIYHYPQNNKLVTEYARISNLAPNGTLGCFGKDTSILTRYPFTLTKEPFVWDNIQSNVIVSNDVPYTEDTAIVTKELVCKIVSRCDSVHINGPAAACVGVPVRYTVSKNSGCFKNLDWSIDTSFANIINLEGDSAITINFKKPFNGYIRAALTDCVVKDSFLVKAVVPVMPPLIKRTDSLLCPGKTLVLAANSGYTNYLWQGNTAGQQFTVNAIGVYTVTAADSCGITQTDSIRVILSDTSLIIPPTQTICLYDTAFITLPNDVNNITWQPTTNSYLNNKTLLFYPPQTTLYTITAERLPACGILKTTTVVIKTCPQTVFIPNSFTPNNDSKNDIFKPAISQPLPFYRLQIFNRYGQTIFESSNQNIGWDGSYKGSRQPMGGYIYQCSYKFNSGVQKMVKGYFILIR